MSSCVILATLIFAAANTALSQEPVLRDNVFSCPSLSNDSDIFGSRTEFSHTGLVSALFIPSGCDRPLNLRILRVHQLCEAIGLRRNTASSVAFLVEFEIPNDPTPMIVEVALDCVADPYNPNVAYSFYPAPQNPASHCDLNTAQSFGDTLIRTGITSNFSTPINRTCGMCGERGGIFFNQETRCGFCSTACNEGMRRCLGQRADQCCNWFLNDTCQITCPSPLVGNNDTFNCDCPVLNTTNFTSVTYDNSLVIGSVASFFCDEDNGYILAEGTAENRTCTVDGWTGVDVTCELFECSMTDLTLNYGEVILLSGTSTFGSVASFNCCDGYEVLGNSTRTCDFNGWTGENPTCEAVSRSRVDAGTFTFIPPLSPRLFPPSRNSRARWAVQMLMLLRLTCFFMPNLLVQIILSTCTKFEQVVRISASSSSGDKLRTGIIAIIGVLSFVLGHVTGISVGICLTVVACRIHQIRVDKKSAHNLNDVRKLEISCDHLQNCDDSMNDVRNLEISCGCPQNYDESIKIDDDSKDDDYDDIFVAGSTKAVEVVQLQENAAYSERNRITITKPSEYINLQENVCYTKSIKISSC